ncbi:uncharacterized protein LOC111382023 [Olea europaea var. sylvestris]|uniref:uncharacterized protein LOC111382023 n=1 Tax=Olea europaea var. sylvestris TaxID=158386 RepID=UPI000C1CCCCA|nr:uncharacterized protein LOC111382023 [Olea europaea var. sylvestris]
MARNQTLKELAAPNLHQQPLCITFPNLDANTTFELKSRLIHLLPTFHGLAEDSAKDWFYYLQSRSVTTWEEMKMMFLEKYFPASRAANIKKEICEVRQDNRESLHEYWERFKKLMVDAASGGVLVDETPEGARNLIANMAANSQQFDTRLDAPCRHVNEMAVGNMQTTKACGICSVAGHPTGMCLTLQKDKQVNTVGSFPGQPQRNYNPYSNIYNPGWMDHSNLSMGINKTKLQVRETRRSIKSLENQMGQMATAINRLKTQGSGKLPSQTMVNPRKNDLVGYRKDELDRKLYDTFGRCEIHIPLIDAIKQIPRYAKFLKYFCNSKRKQKLKGCEKVNIRKNVSAIIQRKIPTKFTDPGMLTIPCTIGDTNFEKAMIDSRASINVMPYSIYASLKLRPLNKIGVVIQLADKSNAYPKGLVEDILL